MAEIDFWFDFASTYSYPAAMRVDQVGAAAGAVVNWRPFLLGPVFRAQGWATSPFNIQHEKGRYMWRDVERICCTRGLAFVRPDPFPQNSLLAARLALTREVSGQRAAFCRAVFGAEFAAGNQISSRDTMADILLGLAIDPKAALASAASDEIKDRLKQQTGQAMRLEIFGAPTFIAPDGEMFWGNDRLEDAVAWSRSTN